MNMGVKSAVIFAAGSAIGALASWYFFKTKYEQIANEEIASVKKYYKDKVKDIVEREIDMEDAPAPVEEVKSEPEEKKEEPVEDKKQQRVDYSHTVEKLGYTHEKGGKEDMDRPFVISPDEFDTVGYETVSLSYYADKVLADDNDDVIEDVDYHVGWDALTHFGEYEDDSVFVRNPDEKIDYEILLVDRPFYEED